MSTVATQEQHAKQARETFLGTDTTYKILFDFTSQDQRTLLQYLQANNYQLLAYKGATGPNQVTAGLPTWFAQPFGSVFGSIEIDYTPQYKVYVYNSTVIGANTTIQMQAISGLVGLGKSLVFNADGSFSPGTVTAPTDGIVLQNNRPAGTPNVTVGLAAYINGQYLPFCAFTSTPQGSVAMTPHESVCLFAAMTSLQSGSVTAVATAPGVSFSFSAAAPVYTLAIAPSTYAVIGSGSSIVTDVNSGASLAQLLNS